MDSERARIVARRVAYYLIVFVVSVAIAAAVIAYLASRDDSSVGRVGGHPTHVL